ncbi:MAG: TatD family hydrolase [Candidatus Nitrosocosmicus sp.]
MGRFFDPHIHMYSRTTDDYEKMATAGIEVIVQPSFWLGSPRTTVGTFVDYWEHMITFETKRAKDFGIDHFTCISVNPKESTERPLAEDALNAMIKNDYFKRDRVVAMGEIGYNLINDLEEEIFIKQLEFAQKENLLVMIHLPHQNKPEGMKKMKRIFDQGNYNFNKMLIDHNTEETIKMTLDMGAWAGLSVYPVSKLSPQRVIGIVNEHGSEKIMVNSAADWGVSDPLSVPKTASEMRKEGCKTADIENVTFNNAFEYYKQSEKFSWRPL